MIKNGKKLLPSKNKKRCTSPGEMKVDIIARKPSNSKLLQANPDNLNCVHVQKMMTPDTLSGTVVNANVPPAKIDKRSSQLIGLVKRHYNIRVTLMLKNSESYQEQQEKIREWIQVLHLINNTVLIYKFNSGDEDDPLSSPDHLPQSYKDLTDWFVDGRVVQEKFCFLVRTSGTSLYGGLRSKLRRWN